VLRSRRFPATSAGIGAAVDGTIDVASSAGIGAAINGMIDAMIRTQLEPLDHVVEASR